MWSRIAPCNTRRCYSLPLRRFPASHSLTKQARCGVNERGAEPRAAALSTDLRREPAEPCRRMYTMYFLLKNLPSLFEEILSGFISLLQTIHFLLLLAQGSCGDFRQSSNPQREATSETPTCTTHSWLPQKCWFAAWPISGFSKGEEKQPTIDFASSSTE